ncbi:MAG: DUF5683 domain-containing protein [Bacteroidales bacterium]|nr:DUF5683 domain-containing protein [Bacteroidales bacterium]MDD4822968.1 DUF5683 domain-containing protein [Bacteroidales bacterium]
MNKIILHTNSRGLAKWILCCLILIAIPSRGQSTDSLSLILPKDSGAVAPVTQKDSASVDTKASNSSYGGIMLSNELRQKNDSTILKYKTDSLLSLQTDSLLFDNFKPDPSTAAWRAVIFPGLGQIYNRKYWKLPLFYGGFMALTYAISWNNKYYKDYSIAYRDLMDDNPATKSYINFLPPGKKETDYDASWLKSTFKRKNDYFRRSRDLSVIGMVGVYLLSVLDAYVDAQLYDFDISPDLSLRVEPTMQRVSQYDNMIGFRCSFTY